VTISVRLFAVRWALAAAAALLLSCAEPQAVRAEPVANAPVALPATVPFEQQPGAPSSFLIERKATAVPTSRPADAASSQAMVMPDWTRIGTAVAAVAALVLVLRFGAGKWWGSSVGGGKPVALRVVGRSVMGHKQQLILIQVGRRLVLAADSNGQVSRLTEITDPEEVSRLLGEVSVGRNPAFSQALVDAEAGIGLLENTPASPPRRASRELESEDFAELATLGERLAEIRRGWTSGTNEGSGAASGEMLEASA
jgi:flagellar biogenesis protein FliO